VLYWQDAGSGQAKWITMNDSPAGRVQLDVWTRQFFPNGGQETTFKPFLNGLLDRSYPALQSPAPLVELPASTVEVLSDTTNKEPAVELRITAPEDVLDVRSS
jgi:hypothetical protein